MEPQESLVRLAADLRASAPVVARTFATRLADVAPEYYGLRESDFQAAGWNALAVVVAGACDELESSMPARELAPTLRAEAVTSARHGMDWEVLSRSYHLTHQVLWEAALAAVPRLGLRPSEQTTLLAEVTQRWFRHFDFLLQAAGQEFRAARHEARTQRQEERLSLVRQVLDGVDVDEARLGYPVTRWHLAVISTGSGAAEAIATGARAHGASSLIVSVGEDLVWGWIAPRDRANAGQVIASLVAPVAGWIAVGGPGPGRGGFASAHREARAVASLCARGLVVPPSGVVDFSSVSLEAVALETENLARTFVEHELGPLLDDRRGAELRETILAYAEHGLNARLTAEHLGVAERTVRYRIERVQQHLGAGWPARWPQVVLATRLAAALDTQRAR